MNIKEQELIREQFEHITIAAKIKGITIGELAKLLGATPKAMEYWKVHRIVPSIWDKAGIQRLRAGLAQDPELVIKSLNMPPKPRAKTINRRG